MGSGGRRVVWTASARRDLAGQIAFIAEDSPENARRLAREVLEAASSLDILSERGRVVPERGEPATRELLIDPFRLIYRVTAREVVILALIHQRRDSEGIAEAT